MGITGVAADWPASDANSAAFNRSDQRLADVFSELVQDKREEFYEKVKTGSFEPSFPIGAGYYTEKEWDRLLESIDTMQEALREEAGLEESGKKDKDESDSIVDADDKYVDAKNMNMLMAEYITCTYPAQNQGEEDEDYIIIYDAKGIRCLNRKTGEFEWAITFTDQAQYTKVKERISSDAAAGESLAFACRESFWQDFCKAR